MTRTQIQIPTGHPPLYDKYPGQCQPQGAYLQICPEDSSAHWDSDAEIGNAVPASVWHNRQHRVPCSYYLSEGQIQMLSDELLPLIDRVIAGHETRWDGSNHRGHLDDDAAEALGAIEDRLRDEPGEAQVWDAGEWLVAASPTWPSLCGEAGTKIDATGAVDAVVEHLEQIADGDGVILEDTERAVESIREEYLDSLDDD